MEIRTVIRLDTARRSAEGLLSLGLGGVGNAEASDCSCRMSH